MHVAVHNLCGPQEPARFDWSSTLIGFGGWALNSMGLNTCGIGYPQGSSLNPCG